MPAAMAVLPAGYPCHYACAGERVLRSGNAGFWLLKTAGLLCFLVSCVRWLEKGLYAFTAPAELSSDVTEYCWPQQVLQD